MSADFEFKYNVDLVFCIDATGSMGKLIGDVKDHAIRFYDDLAKRMAEKGKAISGLRIRIVAFRDYLDSEAHPESGAPMQVTRFYNIPEENAEFEKLVRSIHACGGGDIPEDGLEALAYAIRSDWTKGGDKRRHVIVVWTDAPTHALGFAGGASNYPKGMPKDLRELSSWWGDLQMQEAGQMDQNAKRLVLFVPDEEFWNSIVDNWDNVAMFPAKAGNGLKEVEYEQILDTIYNSIG